MTNDVKVTIDFFKVPPSRDNYSRDTTNLRRITTGHGKDATVEWQKQTEEYIFIETPILDAIEEITRMSANLIEPTLEYKNVEWSEERVLHVVGWETGVSQYDINQALKKKSDDDERRDRDIKERSDRDKAEVERIKSEHPDWF